MKRFLFVHVLCLVSVFAGAQIKTANDLKNTFSARNSMCNRVEFTLDAALSQFNLDLGNLSGDVKSMEVTSGSSVYSCTFNENGQITGITSGGKELCVVVYNTSSLPEIIHFGEQIIAKTYDKKGRVVSEALLYPVKPEEGTQSASSAALNKKMKLTQVGDYTYTNMWQLQPDTVAKIYLFEALTNGKSQSWAIERMFLYDYNGKGQITKKLETSNDVVREALYEFMYKKNLLTQQVKQFTNTNMVENTTYTYENGLLTEAVKGYFRHGSGRKIMVLSSETNTMTYDAHGNLKEFTSNDARRYDSCSVQYDDKQRITKVENRRLDGTMESMGEYSYDDKDYIIATVKNDVRVQYVYEYDAKGNWVKQTITKNGATPLVRTRKIEYR